MTRPLRTVEALILVMTLGACAGPTRVLRPSDFPLHSSDDHFFDLHWRLDRSDDTVRAVGLVEAARVDGIAEVVLELRGLDPEGWLVSRGLGRTRGGRLLRWDRRPFAVELRPRGRETRFELTVWGYTWEGSWPQRAGSGDSERPGPTGT